MIFKLVTHSTIQYTFFAGSTYTCLAIALERYFGICRAQYGRGVIVKKVKYYVLG